MSLKNPVTPPGIDPGTVRLVAHRLNHYATPSPNSFEVRKGKGLPQLAEMAQGVRGSLRPRIILTFRHYKGGSRQLYAPAAFTLGEIPGTHFQRLSRPQGTWFCRGNHGNNHQGHNRRSIPGPSV